MEQGQERRGYPPVPAPRRSHLNKSASRVDSTLG